MLNPQPNPPNDKCYICGAPSEEWLQFTSQYKSTVVYLCAKHFEACKLIYNTAILQKQIDVMLPQ